MIQALGYVYFVDSDSQLSSKPNYRLIKIGYTTRELHKRLTELNTGNPNILKYIHFLECHSYPPKKIEQYIHMIAKPYKLLSSPRSEWYDVPKEFLDWITTFSSDLQLLGCETESC
jgi:hypothetical protein